MLKDFCKRHDGARRRRQSFRPCASIAIQPHRLHARLHRAGDISHRIIADVQHLPRLDPGFGKQSREDSRIRFGRAGRACGDARGVIGRGWFNGEGKGWRTAEGRVDKASNGSPGRAAPAATAVAPKK